MPDIFISYSSHDRAHALNLVERLRAEGYEVWIDKHGIEASTNWSAEIANALTDARSVLFLLSSGALASRNVAKELALAAELDKHIIPIELETVKLSGDFLYHLSGVQRVPISDADAILRALKRSDARTTQQAEKPAAANTKPEERLRLAVLPFDDLSPQKDNEWFADGMMDELINTLGGLSELKVPGRSEVIYYKKVRPKATEIARDLNVRYLVEGSVRKAGEKIRITVQLTDTQTHEHIWSEKYDGTFDDIFDLQESVAKKVTEALRLQLTPEEEKKIEKKDTENPEAYKLYLQGCMYHDKHTLGSYERAIELYTEALRLDPNFTNAHVDITNVTLNYHRFYARDKKWLAIAEEHIRHMQELLGDEPRVLFMRSSLALRSGDLQEALRLAKQSIVIDPNYEAAYQAMGWVYQELGMKEEAVWAWSESVRLNENDRSDQFNYLVAINELGDRERMKVAALAALPSYERHLRFTPDDINARANYANILSWAGEHERALAEAQKLTEVDDSITLYNLACLFLIEGDREQGLTILRRCVEQGYRNVEGVRRDPDLNSVRNMPEFEALMKELEAKSEQEHHT